MTLGHLTAFAWNRWGRDWMFATGTHEGGVHVWTVGPAPEPAARKASKSVYDSALDSAMPPSARSSGSEAPAYFAGDYVQSPVLEHEDPMRPRPRRECTDASSTVYSDDGGTVRDDASADGDDSD